MNLSSTLDAARRDLLDLGLRNALLNYRPLRARGVDVIDEKPVEVFRLLVREEKSLTFLPGEADGTGADHLLAQPDEEGVTAARHKDLRLQTLYTSPQLQARLLATWHAARTSMEEQGVNTLYLALGALVWCEEDSVEKFFRAPLILVPVELDRSNARERFYLKYTGEEPGENISLAEKLKQSFGIREFPTLPDADDLDVAEYFQKVRQAVQGQSKWSVDPEAIALGFFSFAKFLMYRDLDAATWSAPEAILDHRVLQALLGEEGFAPATSSYREDCLLDDQLRQREPIQVVDSDSSQTIATLDSLDGHNMVIQGPPGTGKSQTIVNLIAGAVATGKRVLFVSEKMAALEVVKRRLDRVRLGAACLELHSNRTNKKAVIEELRRTLTGGRESAPARIGELALLGDARDRLNAYCTAVNDPIGASGENPCSVYGKMLAIERALQGVGAPPVKLEDAANWSADEIARRTRLIGQLQDRVSHLGIPQEHPFWGSRLKVLLPTDRDEIRALLLGAMAAGERLTAGANILARTFSDEPPPTLQGVEALCRAVQYVLGAPDLGGMDVRSPVWRKQEPQIRQAVEAGLKHRELHRKFETTVRPEGWAIDVTETFQAIAELGKHWWRFLSKRWRNARKTADSLCRTAAADTSAQLAVLGAIQEAARCGKVVASANVLLAPLLGPSWKGIDSDWDLVSAQVNWTLGATDWCTDARRIAVDRSLAAQQLHQVTAGPAEWVAALLAWADRLQVEVSPFLSQPFAAMHSRWKTQADRANDLHALVAYNQICAECGKEGLGSIAALSASWPSASSSLINVYQRARLRALLERAFLERPALAGFDGLRHQKTVAEFRRLDLLQLEHNRASLAARHAQALPQGGGTGEVGILMHEFEKRARFLPIRSLMLKAGHAVQSVKPVFMMSPLSIANYLPPGAFTFDLVIFDEASQVKPVDALGAIVRGQQVVVVGDSKQLPPTSFFDSISGDEAEAEEDGPSASDVESLLGLLCSRGAHQRMLRWHYRSRHESLIAVSNHLFYEDRLVVFPSPDRERQNLGLIYRRMEKAPYDRSRTRTNPVEAKTVARAVMEHARRQIQAPKDQWETLGVAAFSVAQMTAILTQLELQRREDPSCEEFFMYPPHEPFFVKNLENVQGDERDVIFISVGYGPAADGYLAMSFGPLNRDGGERRLNVLITRARKRCEVFTSLTPDDIDLSRTKSAGAAALKTFLAYARSGELDVPRETDRPPDSEFEEQVRLAIESLGHQVHAQVGSAGFFLDLAVVDPVQPGRYLLGIECDGARYHTARSARDRDRLRQTVLEDLGWRIHRIWSTDWFRNPEHELRKVAEAIELARTATPEPQPASEMVEAPASEPVLPPAAQTPAAIPYVCAKVRLRMDKEDLHLIDRGQLAELLADVVKVESPVHVTEAARRVVNGAGIQRMGSRIQEACNQAIDLGLSRRLFAKKGEFLWTREMTEAPIRDRSLLPSSVRKLELVPLEEVRRAILLVVRESCGIAPEDVPAAVCRLLGFARMTSEMRASVESHREALLANSDLTMEGLNLVLPTKVLINKTPQ